MTVLQQALLDTSTLRSRLVLLASMATSREEKAAIEKALAEVEKAENLLAVSSEGF